MAKSIIWLFFLYTAIECTSCENRGYEYISRLGGYLKLHEHPEQWQAARLRCHLEGAFLAAPWTADFIEAISRLQSRGSQGQQGEDITTVYTGAQLIISEGAYVQGAIAISLDPRDTEQYKRCGVIFANRTTDVVGCERHLPYVCYKPASHACDDDDQTIKVTTTEAPKAPAPTTVAPPVCDDSTGYEFSSTTGHCYKWHTDAKVWPLANETCLQEGGYLAVPNSLDEARLLGRIMMRGNPKWHFGHIGIYQDSDNDWRVVTGGYLRDAGFDTWVEGYPIKGQIYGNMHHVGLLFSSNYDWDRPFICEATHESN